MTTAASYLVRGDDPVLTAAAVRDLVRELVGDADASLVVEDIAGDDLEAAMGAAVDAARTPPFLTDRRVVVLRDVGRFTTDQIAPLVDYLADPLPTTVLVCVGGGGQTPRKLADALKKAGEIVDSGVPHRARDRQSWLAARVAAGPVELDRDALGLLGDHLGEDLGRIDALLATLAAAHGAGARLGAEDLEPYLGAAGGVERWQLTDAIDRGDAPAALGVLRRLLGGGGLHPLQVLATLHGHFSRILRLEGGGFRDEAAAAAALGITGSTFPAKKALAQARVLGFDGVARAIELLARADLDLKGAREIPGDLVLEVLVARLARLRRR